jgi:predicted nucleic acid-binding protein
VKIIADTSVWSLFLRRGKPHNEPKVELLKQAILERRIQMLGIIRQELLSGLSSQDQFKKIAAILEGFPDLPATTEDHILAAKFFNQCRRNGVQGSPVDFLICAQASRNQLKILTTDKDYQHYAEYISIDIAE